MRLVAALLLLCVWLPAQVVRVANYGSAYDGWVRATVDVEPPHAAGRAGDARYVLGRRLGDARVIDLRCRLEPGRVLEVDLARATAAPFALQALPADPLAFFGAPAIAGVPLQAVTVRPDGAGYLMHLRARVGRMLCTDVWAWWYPDQPAWCRGEVVVTASHPGVPDMVATVPAGFRLTFGQASIVVPGLGTAPLLPAGETLADGQAKSFPFTAVWPQHMRHEDWSSAGAAAAFAVCANGIARPWPGGYPALSVGSAQLGWTREHWPGAVERLHRWDFGPLGPVAAGGQTGAQEDQVFIGAECAGRLGLGAETVRYLVALAGSRRPVHHLEADGSLLDLARHPQLVTWSGRAHFHTGVSPDQLGKPRQQNDAAHPDETHGITGQDRQHLLLNTLAIGARLTGSPACQWQLEHHARLLLLQETIDPRLSTSHVDSAREPGWIGVAVAHLWCNLEDRRLAEQVAERWRQRVLRVYIPEYGSKPAGIWDPRPDARIRWEIGLTWAQGWMPEQQSVGAGGIDLACSLVGPPEGRAFALAGARAVLEQAFTREGSRWVEWERLGYREGNVLQPHEIIEGAGAHRTGWYRAAWFPMATATVLRHEPANERALSIWRQQLSDAGGGGSWFLPGVR